MCQTVNNQTKLEAALEPKTHCNGWQEAEMHHVKVRARMHRDYRKM